MANDLNDHVGIHGRPFTPERVRDDGFGPNAAFTPIVAELDGAVVGYAFFALGYNTDFAARNMWLHDIFVAPSARGRGVGRALMTAVAAETVRAGAVSLEWGVHDANTEAITFYRGLGARADLVRIMGVSGELLQALASATS
jgi:GNAT superfamily N-acetyltransferase